MRVLIVSAGDDTGGVGIGLARALNRHTDWEAREVHRTQNYIDYPTDILWPPGQPKPDGLDDLFAKADVIHVMERWQAVQPFDGWQEKPLVMHHHGAVFRANFGPLVRTVKEYGAIPIVSTPDLCLMDPSAEWLPNPCDIGRMKRLRLDYVTSAQWVIGRMIGHSPTSRIWKGTDTFLDAIKGTGLGVELIEKATWANCLARKAKCDLFFDQFFIGYALAGIEAMAMDIPVISGASDPRISELGIPGGRHIVELLANRFGYLPFFLADETNLHDRIVELATDEALQAHFSELGSYHVNRYHDEAKVAKQLVGIYERALAA